MNTYAMWFIEDESNYSRGYEKYTIRFDVTEIL
jgi:hypothetical protein